MKHCANKQNREMVKQGDGLSTDIYIRDWSENICLLFVLFFEDAVERNFTAKVAQLRTFFIFKALYDIYNGHKKQSLLTQFSFNILVIKP